MNNENEKKIDRTIRCGNCTRDLSTVKTDECPNCGGRVQFCAEWTDDNAKESHGKLDVVRRTFPGAQGIEA